MCGPHKATKETLFERAKNMIRAGYGVEPIPIADNCEAPPGCCGGDAGSRSW